MVFLRNLQGNKIHIYHLQSVMDYIMALSQWLSWKGRRKLLPWRAVSGAVFAGAPRAFLALDKLMGRMEKTGCCSKKWERKWHPGAPQKSQLPVQNGNSPCNMTKNCGGKIIAIPLSAQPSSVKFLILQMLKIYSVNFLVLSDTQVSGMATTYLWCCGSFFPLFLNKFLSGEEECETLLSSLYKQNFH